MAVDIKIESHRIEVTAELDKAIGKALEACGIQYESHAKANITEAGRVDTGVMRNSIAHQVIDSENSVYIGSNLEYALYNEVGTGIYAEGGGGRKDPWVYVDDDGIGHRTVGMKPIHFLKRAGSEHDNEYMKIIEKYLSE